MLYKNAIPLDMTHAGLRIFAPESYPLVRQAQLVPVVHIEALALAASFPLCWWSVGKRPVMVVLRTLRSDGSGQPAGSPTTVSTLPLALRAYPFVVSTASGDSTEQATYIEDTTADKPTDIGAPILMTNGRTGRGAEMRLRAVTAYNGARNKTEEMTDELSRSKLFDPWPLEFKIGDEKLKVDGMLIIRQTAFGTPPLLQFLKRFGSEGALFLGAHRISLFRAGSLVQAAQKKAPSMLLKEAPADS